MARRELAGRRIDFRERKRWLITKAEKVQFSLEEKHKKASNDVSKKVKLLRDTVKDLTEMSSFFSEIASPYFKPEGGESEDGLFSAKH